MGLRALAVWVAGLVLLSGCMLVSRRGPGSWPRARRSRFGITRQHAASLFVLVGSGTLLLLHGARGDGPADRLLLRMRGPSRPPAR